MARKGEQPEYSASSLDKPVSSEDLLKQAWESMGRLETGERSGDASTSRSAEMTSAANVSSTATSAQRESAEEIARMLAQETEQRRATERRTQPAPPRPRSTRTRRQRRTEPLQAPERQAPPPQPVPQSQPVPQQQPRPTPGGEQPQRGRRGIGWLIFGLIWLVGSIVGFFAEEDSSAPDIDIDIPEVTIDFSDLTSTTLDASIDTESVTFLSIRDLEPGTCVATLPFGEVVEDVATVPCSEPHQYELYANTELFGDEYPGEDIFSQAFDACGTQFFDYVGETYATSDWYVDVITPTEEGWNNADREVNCLLYLWDEDAENVSYVTGSARSTGDAG